jgi:type III restriction enzyme
LSFTGSQHQEQRLEDYLIRGLIDYDDISYDAHADLLYDLAGQMVKHLLSYLSEEDARNVLIFHQRQLVEFIHVQMQAHYWEKATGYDVQVSKGFTRLRESAFSAPAREPVHDFRQTVQDRSRIAQMVFGGFQRCLYSTQKFQSDSERKLAIILDREALKWFKPARGQFQMFYKLGVDHLEY